jgi:hypothetical protein
MLPSGLAEGKCQCSQSRDQGLLCEHIVAAMLSVMHLYGSDERRKQYEEMRARMERLSRAENLIQRDARGIPAMLRVFIPSVQTLKEAFYADAVRIAIRIYVNDVALKPQELPRKVYAFSEYDEDLIGIFEDIAGGAFSDTMTLSQADFLSVIHCAGKCWVGFGTTRQQLRVQKGTCETPICLRPVPALDALEVSVSAPQNGILLVAQAGKDHLMGLKRVLYTSAYENDTRADLPKGLELICEENLKYSVEVIGEDNVKALFAMTPYYWRTSQDDAKKLDGLETLTTDIDIIFSVYRKN